MLEEIVLKVAEAETKDVGRGLCRLDPDDMKIIGIVNGDIVEIAGKRKTYAKVMPAAIPNRGKKIIQIDGLTRENAGKLSIGERVRIEKTDHNIAERLTLDSLTSTSWTSKDVQMLIMGIPLVKEDKIRVTYGSIYHEFMVTDTMPEGPLIVAASTKINLKKEKEAKEPGKVTYEDIGGLEEEIHKVREMIELPLKFPQVFERLGIEAPKGVLLQGPPGCGKTLLSRAVANESNSYFCDISGPEIFHKWYGQSEEHLRKVFEEAKKNVPSIIFIDELESIASKREGVREDQQVERRVSAQLLALMDGLEERGQVVVMGATNAPNLIDPALRRPGRFDREISIGIPNKLGRLEILEIHTRGMPLAPDVDLKEIAEMTHGFVGADLAGLCREAAMKCLRTIIPDIDFEAEEIPYDKLMSLQVTKEHFLRAHNEIEPSAIREVLMETPDVGWEDVGGLNEVKQSLTETIEWPLKYPKAYQHANTPPPKGILFFGSPGTGKTLVAKAVAKEAGVNFIAIKGPALLSKWVGESEKGIREHFKRAKQAAPCILFFDEADALVPIRGTDTSHVSERTLSQLLSELDGIEALRGVVVLFATNKRHLMDEALLRPGRVDEEIEFPLPDKVTRKKIFEIHTKGKPLAKDVELEKLANMTEGKTGADIAGFCQRAGMLALREFMLKSSEQKKLNPDFSITFKHFERALGQTKKEVEQERAEESVPKKDEEFYSRYEENRKKGLKEFKGELEGGL